MPFPRTQHNIFKFSFIHSSFTVRNDNGKKKKILTSKKLDPDSV